MSGLPFFPADALAGLSLRDALAEWTRGDEEWAGRVVNAILEDFERCPTPSDIRRVAWAERPQERPTGHEHCGKCDGSGWVLRRVGEHTGAVRCSR
jgi:hypothetical protein